MRLLRALRQDVRYQLRYGFYFIYAIFTALYVGILLLIPAGEIRSIVAVIMAVSDPTMLGFLFIGGIWLLEKGENVQAYYCSSPLKPMEYILSKCMSLSMLSVLSSIPILIIGFRPLSRVALLIPVIFFASMVFTLTGLVAATFAKSVNNYMINTIPFEIVISLPVVLYAFGIRFSLLRIFPGTILWILASEGAASISEGIVYILALLVWLALALGIARLIVPKALAIENGGLL